MPTAAYFTQCFVKVDGQDLPEQVMASLAEVAVDTSLHLPDMFTILFNDSELELVDNNLFDIGKQVQIDIETGEEQGGLRGTLIKGEITALEPQFSAQGRTTMLVRGYDKSHRLHRGKKTRTFLNRTDNAIVQTIAGEAGLLVVADSPGITYDFVMQNNQTNMEFLLTRAARLGYQVYTAEGKLYFKKGDASLGEGPALSLGDNLKDFRPRLTASHQADKIIVKGWDAKGKQAITAEATPNARLNQGGMRQTGGAKAAAAFGSAEAVVTDQPVFTPNEATALATALGNDINRESIQAEGTCVGDPRVKAGWTITIEDVGNRFKGKYFVTSATHVYKRGSYETTFSISGRQPNTLSHLLQSGNGHTQSQGLMPGVVTGLVTNVNDPDNLGRVKVKYAWLGEIESDWIRIATPMGGPKRGFYYLPEVNDEVLIAFAHGNTHHPYIVGFLWNNQDKPPKPNSEVASGGIVNERIIKSRSGHLIILDDTDGQEKIIIRDKTEKNEIIIDSAQNTMTINVQQDLIIKAQGKIDMEATRGDVSIKGMNVNIQGTTKGDFKAQQIGINGSAKVDVKGGMVNLN